MTHEKGILLTPSPCYLKYHSPSDDGSHHHCNELLSQTWLLPRKCTPFRPPQHPRPPGDLLTEWRRTTSLHSLLHTPSFHSTNPRLCISLAAKRIAAALVLRLR